MWSSDQQHWYHLVLGRNPEFQTQFLMSQNFHFNQKNSSLKYEIVISSPFLDFKLEHEL